MTKMAAFDIVIRVLEHMIKLELAKAYFCINILMNVRVTQKKMSLAF